MKNIIAIGASNSTNSINRQFASWAARQVHDAQVDILDLNDYEMPIYSLEREQETGIPEPAKQIKDLIRNMDGMVISFAEHNGSYSTAFKNIFDWISRLEGPIWENKPMLLLATSPGPRGAASVLSTATKSFPYQGAMVSGSFSLPSFPENFNQQDGIVESSLRSRFKQHLTKFSEAVQRKPAGVTTAAA